MIILCDIDGVAADLHAQWVRWYNRTTGSERTTGDIHGWYVHEYLGMTDRSVYEYLDDPSIYDTIEPVRGFVPAITKLRNDGHRIVFVTSSCIAQNGRKLRWLMKHGAIAMTGAKSSPDYIEASDKSLIKGDIMIDDYGKNLAGFDGHRILFSHPHNEDVNEWLKPGEFHRVWGWQDCVDEIRRYVNEINSISVSNK